MPAKRELTMRQLRQMLRLHHDGLGAREIGRRLHVARSTIQDNLKRSTQAAGLTWPLAPDLTDELLEQRLFSRGGSKPSSRRRAEPDWAVLARELKRRGVNLVVLWRSTGPTFRTDMAIRVLRSRRIRQKSKLESDLRRRTFSGGCDVKHSSRPTKQTPASSSLWYA
jgi:hypothetical protein